MTSLIFRWLTAVYYANQDWSESDGGVLRLYRPEPKATEPPPATGGEDDGRRYDALLDVAPLGDRLVLFFSDSRVPHEVMRANAPRFAVTLWYTERKQNEPTY